MLVGRLTRRLVQAYPERLEIRMRMPLAVPGGREALSLPAPAAAVVPDGQRLCHPPGGGASCD